jgi:hypothetical protein
MWCSAPELPADQVALVKAVAAANPRVVVALSSGSAVGGALEAGRRPETRLNRGLHRSTMPDHPISRRNGAAVRPAQRVRWSRNPTKPARSTVRQRRFQARAAGAVRHHVPLRPRQIAPSGNARRRRTLDEILLPVTLRVPEARETALDLLISVSAAAHGAALYRRRAFSRAAAPSSPMWTNRLAASPARLSVEMRMPIPAPVRDVTGSVRGLPLPAGPVLTALPARVFRGVTVRSGAVRPGRARSGSMEAPP